MTVVTVVTCVTVVPWVTVVTCANVVIYVTVVVATGVTVVHDTHAVACGTVFISVISYMKK